MKKYLILIAGFGLFSRIVFPQSALTVYPRSHQPEELLVLERKGLSNADWHLATIIQGRVNREKPRIFIVSTLGARDGANLWLNYYEKEYGIKNSGTIGLEEALKRYAGLFQGYALFSFKEPWTVNIADSYCALNDCLSVTPEQEKLAKKSGLKKLEDFRGRWQENILAVEWAFKNLYPKCSKKTVASIMPGRHSLRDYAYAHRLFMFFLPIRGAEYFALKKLIARLPRDTPMMGYVARSGFEELLIELMLAHYDKYMVPTDTVPNLSVHSGIPIQPLPKIPQNLELPDISGKLGVVFAITDGDNLYLESEYYLREDFWQDSDRGKIKVAWSMAPELYELAPGIIRYYYQTRTDNDFFVVFSGAGYAYTSFFPNPEPFVRLTKEYMELTGLDLLWHIDPQFYLLGDQRTYQRWAEPFREKNFLKGVMIGYFFTGWGRDWDAPPGYPSVLYEKASYLINEPKTVAKMIKAEARSVPARGTIVFFGMCNWETNYDDFLKIADYLKDRQDIVLLSPQEAFAIIEKWRGESLPGNSSLQKRRKAIEN